MAVLFHDWPEALENTQKIDDMCQMGFRFGEHHSGVSGIRGKRRTALFRTACLEALRAGIPTRRGIQGTPAL
jgi:DNA polymerase III alpha subunit